MDWQIISSDRREGRRSRKKGSWGREKKKINV